jgi:ribulose kinase
MWAVWTVYVKAFELADWMVMTMVLTGVASKGVCLVVQKAALKVSTKVILTVALKVLDMVEKLASSWDQ